MVVTLGDVEREVMRRTGPFEQHVASSATASSGVRVYVDALQSTLDLGGYTGLWLLRRGYLNTGTPVAGFATTDRQRRLKSVNVAGGYLEVDRTYAASPIATEALEVCHLDPARVIRPAVQAGLARVKVEDRVQVTLTGLAAERNLTTILPWLTSKSQVKGVFYKEVGSLYDPVPVHWFGLFEDAGSVWITIAPDPYPNTLYVKANRPADTLANGGTVTSPPDDDLDELACTLQHGAAAGHIECWRSPRAAALLRAMADRGYTATQKEAADEFTRMNRRKITRSRVRWQLDRPLWIPVRA